MDLLNEVRDIGRASVMRAVFLGVAALAASSGLRERIHAIRRFYGCQGRCMAQVVGISASLAGMSRTMRKP